MAAALHGGSNTPRLPKIQHPAASRVSPGELSLTAKSLHHNGRVRPRSCPASSVNHLRGYSSHQHSRAATIGTLQMSELISLLSEKLQGSGYYTLQHGFKSFDPKGVGNLSSAALYRLLCNTLCGISQRKYNELMSRLQLSHKKSISFDEFISSFHLPAVEPGWMDPVSRPHITSPSSRQRQTSTFLPPPISRPLTSHSSSRVLFRSVNITHHKLFLAMRQLDRYKSGKLTPEQIRLVFTSFGVRITPLQMTELVESLGYHDNQLVDYTTFLNSYSERKIGGVVDRILKSPGRRYHVDDSKRACTSVDDAETRIVTLLQKDFLSLLAHFKSLDPRNHGYIKESDFLECLRVHLGVGYHDNEVEELLPRLKYGDWVAYPTFLAMFEGRARPPQREEPIEEDTPPPGVSLDDLLGVISVAVGNKVHDVVQEFVAIDTKNTGRLTISMVVELLQRFGVLLNENELRPLWNTLIKNKDGTVDFSEFIRVFASRPSTAAGKQLTEDHHFMRSKNLHRDEDIVMNTLRAKMIYYHSALLRHFKSLDQQQTGTVQQEKFKQVVLELCPELTGRELTQLSTKLADSNGFIPYHKMLSQLSGARAKLYRVGNDMGRLLEQKGRDGITDTECPVLVAVPPTHGLPGVKAELQRKVANHWRVMRRLFRRTDRSYCGNVSVKEFTGVLAQCDIELNNEQLFHILEALDPDLTGQVNYSDFINIILEQ